MNTILKRVAKTLFFVAAGSGLAANAAAKTVTVSNRTQRAITAAISSACKGAATGTVLFPDGTYTLNAGFHVPSNCTLQAQNQGQATLSINKKEYAIYLDGNDVTVTGFVLNGGGISTTQSSTAVPHQNVTISYNTFQNIYSGGSGIASDGYWNGFNISYNHFTYISSIPWSLVTTSTVVEGGSGYDGLGINNVNGMDQTTIDHNTFDHILGDALHIMFNWTMATPDGVYNEANNNDISYNTFHDLHRMAIEIQGTGGGCPGGCLWRASANIIGLTIKGNFNYHQYLPYYDAMGFSLVPDGATNPLFLNNTAVYGDTPGGCGASSYAMENSGDGQLSQGNVLSSAANCGNNWSQYFQSGSITGGYLITHQNNLLCGPTKGGGGYFGWEGRNQHTGNPTSGTTLDRYNYTSPTCPNANSPSTSTLAIAFTTADNESFPNHGDRTFSLYATDEISVVNVRFFLDGSTTPVVTQELQDLNTNFASDRKWLYHATIHMVKMNAGVHTISAVATDVSGAVQTVKQSFQIFNSR